MDETVDHAESITRYLRNSSHLRSSLGRPHYSAYLPSVPDGVISVYRTAGMAPVDIEALGSQYVGSPGSPLKGHCDLAAGEFFSEGLNIESVPIPHERHANVKGWTADPRNRIVARKLADKAKLAVY